MTEVLSLKAMTVDSKKPEFLKYIDVELLNSIMNKIANATGMGIAACDYTGIPLAGTAGYCEFCKCVQESAERRRACEASSAIGEIQAATIHEPYIYVCPHGLLEVSIPIDVDGKFMGGIVAGQVLCQDIPEHIIRVSSIFPAKVLCTEKFAEEKKNCTKMTFDEFYAIAQMLYSILTELFKSKVGDIVDDGEITNIVKENMELKISIQKLEAERLRSLVKTNFIVRSLFTIANKAAIEGAVETNEMVGMLSKLIEDLIMQGDKNCFLCDEIRIIERYLLIQQQQIEDLEFELNIPEDVKLYKIPAMMIYQIVEYSINYGLLYKEGLKKIITNITEDDKFLYVTILDNGLGMKCDEVRAVYPQIVEEYSIVGDTENGIQMLKERIKLLFNSEGKLSMTVKRGSGSEFKLAIPIAFAKGEGEDL